MTAFKASIGFTLLATGSCSSRSRPQADKGYEVCRNPLKWNTPGCINLFKNMNKEDSSETSFARIINGDNVSFGEYPWFAKPLNSFGVWYGKFPWHIASAESISKRLIITFILTLFIGLVLCSGRLWSYVSFS